MKRFPSFEHFGEHACLVRWEPMIDMDIHIEILRFRYFISENFSKEIIETVPAYNELALYFKADISVSEVFEKLMKTYKNRKHQISVENYKITIPVCYHEDFAPDIKRVADHTGMARGEVIQKHIEPQYTVYFLGFLPGFPYLGNLNPDLHTPRLDSPREHIPKGSIAIGGSQTGIYPSVSPGGWNIIGRSPIHLFNLNTPQKTLLKAGDTIKFTSISKKEFATIERQIENGTYLFEKEVRFD